MPDPRREEERIPLPPVAVAVPSCEGYVWKYSIILPQTPKDKIYFRFTISSKIDKAKDLLGFILWRNIRSEVIDQDEEQKLWAISYSSISMAIIATLKDAMISGKKVRVTYQLVVQPPDADPAFGRRVTSVDLIKE